jgi:hypothetical protein
MRIGPAPFRIVAECLDQLQRCVTPANIFNDSFKFRILLNKSMQCVKYEVEEGEVGGTCGTNWGEEERV